MTLVLLYKYPCSAFDWLLLRRGKLKTEHIQSETCTDLCRNTSSEWNLLGSVSDVSGAVRNREVFVMVSWDIMTMTLV